MKNIRKIVAILAAVLMLCSVLPMSAFAVEGDIVASIDWNDGELKFDKGEIAEGPDGSSCFKWTATGGWSATYMVIHDMDSTKDYTITMKAKATVNGNMGVTIQNGDWGSYWNAPAFAVTTEWQDVVYTIPANSIPFTAGAILFKFQDVGQAMDLYVDDFVVSEGLPKKPLCENGDFESGKEGWTLEQSTVIDAAAAHSGNYGAHLIGGVNWNTMLDRTFDVVAGKNYELSYWAKVVSGGTNIKYLDQNWQGASVADGGWFNKTEWTQITVPFTAISDKFYFQFCGAGDMSTEMYVDDVKLIEIKDPSFDGYIYNGDFETGKTDHWTNLWDSSNIELVAGMNGDYALKGTANGAWNIVYQEVDVTPNTNYTVWAYAKDASNSSLWIKNAGGNGDITNKTFAGGSDWSLTSVSFNSGSNNKVWIGLMGLEAGGTYTVDDIFMFEAKEASNDGYIINGNFETGSVSPWENLWGSCPTVEIIKGGKDDNFSLDLVSGEWKHLRQTDIAVEANTDYKISLWAKNVKNMNLLVKDGGDSTNLNNKAIEGGEDWTYNEFTFNTGDYTTIIVSLMGGAAEAYGSFDNIVMEKVEAPVCEHEYDGCLDADCNLCGETREAGHQLQYNPAKDAIDCANPGNIENWFCTGCFEYFADAECTTAIAPWFIEITVDCVRPEGIADCATVTCETCGNEIYGSGEHDVLTCQGGTCSKCNAEIEGVGCQNYDTPACQDGVCYYCGGFVAGFGHENGAWAACCDGECTYGCGLTYPATEDHVDEDADDYCDNCWNHLNHDVGPCGGECSICWTYIEGEHTYFDDCSAICEVCGYEREVSHNIVHVEAKAPTCIEMGNIEYWYCDKCGMAWLDADCTLNTNLRAVNLPATGEHTYDDEYDADCNVCGDEREVPEKPGDDIIYGDADGDGEITLLDAGVLSQYLSGYDVEIDLVAGDADGDGEVTLLDAGVLSQYLSGYDVTLGPQEAPLYNDGELSGWGE